MQDFKKLLKDFKPHKFFKCQLEDGTTISILADDSILIGYPKDEDGLIDFLNYLVENISNSHNIRFSIDIPFDESKLLSLMEKTKFHHTSGGVFYTYVTPINKKAK